MAEEQIVADNRYATAIPRCLLLNCASRKEERTREGDSEERFTEPSLLCAALGTD